MKAHGRIRICGKWGQSVELDHIAVTAERLEDGVAAVEAVLGVPLAGGGRHELMGTHNRLLGLGDLYLEVIAVDPEGRTPDRPRWFDMDHFAGSPRLTNWIARCDNLATALSAGPEGLGDPLSLSRGDLRWQMAVPASGILPFDNACPALIEWQGTAHPAARLPDSGCRLKRLIIVHPKADELRSLLADRLREPRLVVEPGPEKALRAEIRTPGGVRVLE